MRAPVVALGAAAALAAPVAGGKPCQPPPLPHGWVPPVTTRTAFPTLLNELGLLGKAVELGSHSGEYALAFRSEWKGQLFYAVDPWEHQPGDQYVDIANVDQDAQNERLLMTARRLAPYADSAVLLREYSTDAVKRFDNNSVSFVYIDANHAYEAVARDIADWWPKVEPGGILAGHDYIPDGNHALGDFGVQRAVREFAEPLCLPVWVTYTGYTAASTPSAFGDAAFPSWYVFKPLEEGNGVAVEAAAPAAEAEAPAAAPPAPPAPAVAVSLGDPEDEDLSSIDFIKPQDL